MPAAPGASVAAAAMDGAAVPRIRATATSATTRGTVRPRVAGNRCGKSVTITRRAPRSLEPGVYRITFQTQAYFQAHGGAGFYPYVPIVFELQKPEAHYHVPLLLSPFGYSTYRGS